MIVSCFSVVFADGIVWYDLVMDVVEEVKEKLNIVEIISPYVTLRKRGSNWFGLCPFHNEKSGSFSVNEDRGFFHCFGCGESGDIFTFIQKVEHVDFRESLEMLAKKANVDLSKSVIDKKYTEKKNIYLQINELTKNFYLWMLQKHELGERGREYVKKRKIKESAIEKYQLGYAPTGETNLYHMMQKKGYANQQLIDSGVCIRRERDNKIIDKFRGRLMFPILDNLGRTVGFSGRHIPVPKETYSPPKYLNTGETSIFLKGKILYGFYQAVDEIMQKGFVILSEGQMNIVSSFQTGVKNIVASMGTALTVDHLKFLSRYTKNLYLCFDNDGAGHTAMLRSSKMALKQDFNIRVIRLRFGSDPDEEIQKDEDAWRSDIELAQELFDYLIDEAKRTYKGIDDKNRILGDFVEIYHSCVNPIMREVLVQKLSNDFDVTMDTLMEFFATRKTEAVEVKIATLPTPSHSLSVNDIEEFTLAIIVQNYDTLHDQMQPEHSIFFQSYETIYEKLHDESLDKVLQDENLKQIVESLLAKNLPETEDIIDAYADCIRRLKTDFVKRLIATLKDELSFADETRQSEILKEIDELVHSLDR